MDNNYVRLLWTGGWDSTFRLVELSRMDDVTIQPTYLFGDGRNSAKYERNAMDTILDMLFKRDSTKANILPIQFVDINTIPANEDISNAYNRIKQSYKLGSQYEWIPRYAALNPNCEICSEKPSPHGIGYLSNLIKQEGEIVTTGDIHRYKVISKSKDVMQIVGNLCFPLKSTTDEDMVNLIHEWGYEDVMKNIWFCFTPLKGAIPCGLCRPCAEKMECGMGFLLDEKARRRYQIYKKWGETLPFRVYRKLLFGFCKDKDWE